jgi:hypothetical protein
VPDGSGVPDFETMCDLSARRLREGPRCVARPMTAPPPSTKRRSRDTNKLAMWPSLTPSQCQGDLRSSDTCRP